VRLAYLLKRLGLLLLVLWTAATLNFLVPKLAPRNPILERLMEQQMTGGYLEAGLREMVEAYEKEFGLDQPVWKQYLRYMANMTRLDLGYSIAFYPKTVMQLLGEAVPWTIGLLSVSTLIAFTLGTLLGAMIGWPKSPKTLQYMIAPLMTFSAVPYYLFSLVLIYLLAFRGKILPLGGGYTIGAIPSRSLSFALDIIRHSILPALSIVLAGVGSWALGMRGMMVTVQGEDYMTLAEAKGLKGRRIFFRYAMRNALLPQVTSLALSLGHLVSGSVLVETVFGYPGVGSLLHKSIRYFDYFTIYGVVFMVILGISAATLIMDLVYPLLDPRITYERG